MRASNSNRERRLYEFGDFRLDVAERLLLRGGEPVPLTPKAFETLVVLVRNSGHVLAKQELLSLVWPDTFVEETTLSSNIYVLRKALGEAPDGRPYIETVPKLGYRFEVPVAESPLEEDSFIIERRRTAHLIVEQENDAIPEPEPVLRQRSRLPARVIGSLLLALAIV